MWPEALYTDDDSDNTDNNDNDGNAAWLQRLHWAIWPNQPMCSPRQISKLYKMYEPFCNHT